MASQASAIIDALGALIATATGLSAAKVVRGSPIVPGRPQPSPPCVYVWLQTAEHARGPSSRKWGVTLTLGWYVHATAAGSTTASLENAAMGLTDAVLVAVMASPTISGTAHDLERWTTDLNGAVPGSDGTAPSSWVAGSCVIRYDTTGGL